MRQAASDGVREAPRHEIAGGEAPRVRLALWGFEACCSADGRAGGLQQGAEAARASGRMWWEALRAGHCRRLSEPGGSDEARGVVAGSEPAGRIGSGAVRWRSHDVSILITTGVGRCLGSQPRAKTSMTIMRPPQQGHGQA